MVSRLAWPLMMGTLPPRMRRETRGNGVSGA